MKQKTIKDILKDFGLSQKEVEVYLSLEKLGVLKAGELAKHVKIDRSVVYRILKKLENKGFVESTLEFPTRFVPVSLEKALDIIIKTKEDQAFQIKKVKRGLLEEWEKVKEKLSESKYEKFSIIEGNKQIYQKIQQMINETKQELCGILTVSDLERAEQFGIFDPISINQPKSNVHFLFATEINNENKKALKLLVPKIKKEITLKIMASSSRVTESFPRVVIRDKKEVLIFSRPNLESFRSNNDVCIYTNSDSLVKTFYGVFEGTWKKAFEISTNVLPKEIENNLKLNFDRVIEPHSKQINLLEEELEGNEKDYNHIPRLDQLKESDIEVLECASVIGEEFSSHLIEKTLGLNKIRLLKQLTDLEKNQFLIHLGEYKYRFSNKNIREKLYNQIEPKIRKAYHNIIAKTIEDRFKDRVESFSKELAYHYYQSRNVAKAVPALMKAAQETWNPKLRLYEYNQAIKYYSQAFELIRNNNLWKKERIRVLEKMGDVYSSITQHDKANEFYEKGLSEAPMDEIKTRIRNKIRKKRILSKNGVEIAYFVYGKSNKTLLFVANSIHFMPQIHYLAQKYRVAVMDIAEVVDPDKLAPEYSLEFYLEAMKSIIEDLDEENINLASLGPGGTLSIYYLAKYPGKIKKLVLMATPSKPAYDNQPNKKQQFARFWADAFQSPAWGYNKLKEQLWAVGAHSGIIRETRRPKSLIETIRDQNVSPETMLILLKIFMETDVRPLLKKIKIPTLILHSDKLLHRLPLNDLKCLRDGISGSTLGIFKNVRAATYEAVDNTNEVLEAFFEDGTIKSEEWLEIIL